MMRQEKRTSGNCGNGEWAYSSHSPLSRRHSSECSFLLSARQLVVGMIQIDVFEHSQASNDETSGDVAVLPFALKAGGRSPCIIFFGDLRPSSPSSSMQSPRLHARGPAPHTAQWRWLKYERPSCRRQQQPSLLRLSCCLPHQQHARLSAAKVVRLYDGTSQSQTHRCW